MKHISFKWIIVFLLICLVAAGFWLAPVRADSHADSLIVTERAKLTASDGQPLDLFGGSLAIDADTAVLGAFYADIAGKSNQGAAYVYYRNLGGPEAWGQKIKLIAADGNADDELGRSAAIDMDTIAVGASKADVSGKADQGAVYLFERNAGGADAWGQVKKITAVDGSASDYFGDAISLDGDVLVIGAILADIAGNVEQGAVYVYYRNLGGTNNWGQAAKIVSSDGSANDLFSRLDVTGDVLVVGASNKNYGQGSGYVFYRNQGGSDAWGEVKKLVASDGAASDRFGVSVSVSGEFIVSGAFMADQGGQVDRGAAYIYQRDAGGDDQWGQVKKVLASDGAGDARFGQAVAVEDERLLVGAYIASPGGVWRAGSAYVYQRNEGGWMHGVKLPRSQFWVGYLMISLVLPLAWAVKLLWSAPMQRMLRALTTRELPTSLIWSRNHWVSHSKK